MGENLKKLGTQFKEFWRHTDATARFGIISTLVFSIALIIGVGIWSAQPTYVKLTDDVAPGEFDNILQDLDKKNIRYETSEGGTVISVEKSQLSRARSILHNYQTTDNADSGWGGGMASPVERAAKLKSKTEQRLASSIEKINGIKSATVHLTIAKDRFVNQKPSKASVVLELIPNFDLSARTVDAIADIVSFAPGLSRENVSISDNRGRSYRVSDHEAGGYHGKFELIGMLESKYRRAISEILDSQVGFGKYSVSVNVESNYVNKSTKSVKRSGDGLETDTTKLVSTSDSRVGAGGVTGVSGNLTQPASFGSTSSPKILTENTTSTKVYDLTEISERELDTSLTQIAVSAHVELPVDDEGNALLTKEDVEASIKACIGFDDVTRKDVVTVQTSPFAANPLMAEMLDSSAAPLVDDFVLNIIKQSSLGLGLLFAMVIGFLIIRKLNPITISEPEQQISPDRARKLADLSKIANENPEFLSRVIAGWINETPADEIADPDLADSKRAAA